MTTTAELIDQLERLQGEFSSLVAPLVDEQAIRAAQAQFLGKKGQVSAVMKELGRIPPAERPRVGEAVNRVKGALQASGCDAGRLHIALVQFAVLYRGTEKISMSTRAGQFCWNTATKARRRTGSPPTRASVRGRCTSTSRTRTRSSRRSSIGGRRNCMLAFRACSRRHWRDPPGRRRYGPRCSNCSTRSARTRGCCG